MGMELPGWLTGPLGAIGMEWPKGDETALDRMADHWSSFGSDIDQLTGDLVTAANSVLNSIEGETHDALQTHLQQFFSGDKSLEQLKQDAEYLADCCSNTSNEVLTLKIFFIVELVALAAFIIAAAASAWINWGAPAEIAAAEVGTQLTLRAAVQKAIEEIIAKLAERGLKQIAKESAMDTIFRMIGANGAKDLAIQLGTKAAIGAGVSGGTEFSKQLALHEFAGKDFDWKKIGSASLTGASVAVIAAPLSMPLNTSYARLAGAEFNGNKMRWIAGSDGKLDALKGIGKSLTFSAERPTYGAFGAMAGTSLSMSSTNSLIRQTPGLQTDTTPSGQVAQAGKEYWQSLSTTPPVGDGPSTSTEPTATPTAAPTDGRPSDVGPSTHYADVPTSSGTSAPTAVPSR